MKDLLLFADGDVGFRCVEWLVQNYSKDVGLIVTTANNHITQLALDAGLLTCVFHSTASMCDKINQFGLEPDIGMLLWWPNIVKGDLLHLPKEGFVNTHPSLLPHNRGKHYSFWAIVESVPFGVTIHRVDSSIDGGDIFAQTEIPVTWEDTGETLYEKARTAMLALVQSCYPKLRIGNLKAMPQDPSSGSFHFASEIDLASRIELDQRYTGRGLLNLLRAKTFKGLPGCRFEDNGRQYDVTITIKEIT